MSLLKVAHLGNPILRQKSRMLEPEEIKSPRIQKLIDDMIETMREYDGVGLAAPQVHESVNILVLEVKGNPRYPDALNIPLTVFANLRFVSRSKDKELDWEGCLSVPDLRGQVNRPRSVEIEALDRNGKRINLKASGFLARIIQHEADHLDGKVFLDQMDDFSSLTFLKEFERFHAGA
jgi:peptide deformylase